MKLLEKRLVLGTALWGWSINKKEAFSILESFIDLGGRYIDCATNYPINKNIQDHGLALEWLEEWNNTNNTSLFIIVKIGSMDNLGSPNYDLSKNRIMTIYKELQSRFGKSLGCISVHWDNRKETELEKVKETISAFKQLKKNGLRIGLSGIKNPILYYETMHELSDKLIIQCKENFLTDNSRLNYQEFFPLAEYYAYGINMGGLKISKKEESVSAKVRKITYPDKLKLLISKSLNDEVIKDAGIQSVNDLNMAYIYTMQVYNGIIVGPRTTEQLIKTFETWEKLTKLDSKSFEKLKTYLHKLQLKVRQIDRQ